MASKRSYVTEVQIFDLDKHQTASKHGRDVPHGLFLEWQRALCMVTSWLRLARPVISAHSQLSQHSLGMALYTRYFQDLPRITVDDEFS